MRLYEVVTIATNASSLKNLIKDQCQPWLSLTDSGRQVVYRGLGSSQIESSNVEPIEGYSRDAAFKKPIRPDRKVFGNTYYREVYNKVLSNLGAVATRTNSVSVSGDNDEAQKFGTAFVFLPVGEFHYTWSTEIIDWGSFYLQDSLEFTQFRRDLEVEDKGIAYEDVIKRYITPTIIFDKFNSVSLQFAIQSKHEISIHASHGLYIYPTLYKELFGT